MYSVMWSEHCSYKSSKVHLKQFSEIPQETPIGKMLAGIGENAGVIDIGRATRSRWRLESHNHPSYVEPYQGAATGVGGIVRDILAIGARPVAVMDPLRFGPLDADDTHRVLPGIVAGVGGYGNCLGLPTSAARPSSTRPTSATRSSTRSAWACSATRTSTSPRRPASATGCCSTAPGPAATGSAESASSRARRSTKAARQAAQRPGRRPVHGEAPHRVHPRAVRSRDRDRHPGPRRRRAVLRDVGARQRGRRRGAPFELDRVPLRDWTLAPRGDPHERVAGADDGRGGARRRRRVPRHLRQVGGRGRRHR